MRKSLFIIVVTCIASVLHSQNKMQNTFIGVAFGDDKKEAVDILRNASQEIRIGEDDIQLINPVFAGVRWDKAVMYFVEGEFCRIYFELIRASNDVNFYSYFFSLRDNLNYKYGSPQYTQLSGPLFGNHELPNITDSYCYIIPDNNVKCTLNYGHETNDFKNYLSLEYVIFNVNIHVWEL